MTVKKISFSQPESKIFLKRKASMNLKDVKIAEIEKNLKKEIADLEIINLQSSNSINM
jgi:hypothetical protein